jgi:hypothetical protein
MKDKICSKSMNFNECELAILRIAVDKAGEKIGKRIANSEDVKDIIEIVENFIKKKNLICYGGTAINNLLPKEEQFYNKDVEIPDYDFFSHNALDDAKELANIYYDKGYTDVEAKSGQHHGTYKVYVNYMPVADITHLPKEIFEALNRDSIRVAGILYAPPNFLRMSMYLELSRPAGDTSRWEKVLKRLTLLNKNYPLTSINCDNVEIQREMFDKSNEETIYDVVRETFINQSVVFFGGYAISLYSQYMPNKLRKKLNKIADFEVLSNEPETTAEIVKERLKDINIKNVEIIKRDSIGEIIPEHYEIKIDNDTIAFIYKPVACHSYNIIHIKGQNVKIATIDTMLSFYLAFLYTGKDYFKEFTDRILCMSKFLFDVQQKNRLEQKGLLKRFSITCIGHQESVEEMRAEKAEKYQELKNKKNSKEYEEWFLNYRPEDNKKNKQTKTKTPVKNKKTKKNNKKQKILSLNFWGKTKKLKNKDYKKLNKNYVSK